LPLIVDETSGSVPGSKPIAIVDSGPISEYIEKSYPDRPFVTKDLLSQQEAHIAAIRQNVTFPLFPIIVPGAGKNFDEPTITFYNTTRPGIFGEIQRSIIPVYRLVVHILQASKR
jgi:glutathione S-transferase